MPVLHTCTFEEVRIKTEGVMNQAMSNKGSQALKVKYLQDAAAKVRTYPRLYVCSSFQQVRSNFDKN